ncbi:MAG: hypothetical protein ABI614_04545 [Planctomycetota bacterium]
MRNLPESNDILQRMEEVRSDLDEDVQEIVEGVRDMRDWRSYVRTYPWVCVGAALAVGCIIVPRRGMAMQPIAKTLAELAKQSRLAATPGLSEKNNTSGLVLAFVGRLVLREAASFVGQQAREFLATQAGKSPQDDQP